MNQSFDYFGNPEIPYMILCNPNREELFSLGLAYDTKISLRFNAISEFSFTYPSSIDGGQTTLEAYEYLKNKRLVLVEGYGYFQITNAEEDHNGSVPILRVSCDSQEVELIQKRVTAYGGTKPLYDIITPDGTLLQDMLDRAPNWSIGTVDVELLGVFRTFNVSDTNVYNFLTNEVSKAFECIFIYDTVNRTISAKTIDNATTETDIFLSFNNLISNSSFSEKADELSTVLSVFGNGNLNINLVNPLGTSKIYNFDYYKTTEWMSQELIDAIDSWEAIVASQQADYTSNLLALQTANGELLDLQSVLATLNEEFLVLEGVQKVRIQQDLPYADITAQMDAKQLEIDAQVVLIENKQTEIATITSDLQTINTTVSFASNFTSQQLLELDSFMFENTYRNENIVQTDIMTASEIQDQAQALYNQAINVLEKVSQPRYEFSLDSVNYISLPEFAIFTAQTELGCIVTAEIKEDIFIQTVLLEIVFQFDSPTDFSLTFSNRLRIDDGAFTYSDLAGEVARTGSNVAFDSLKWSNWENEYKNDVTNFITSALNTTTNNLISNSNQEIVINQNGLRARQSDGAGGYTAKQAWLVNNVLAFSDDGFQTAKLALGEISLPEGGSAYGLVADVIVGRLLAGTQLTIENENNNFVLNSNGAFLNNATFTVETTNAKIIIDPLDSRSFRIQKNEGGTFNDKFWVDNTGNVNFAGNLSGATGTFSGSITATLGNIGTLVIDSQGLKTSNNQNYLRGNGDLKWGGLSISGSTATFDGTIFANKLVGQVVDDQVASGLNAGKVTNGAMSGNRISGGSPTVSGINPGGSFTSFGGGIGTSFLSVFGGSSTFGNSVTFNSNISIGGSISVSGGSGISGTYSVTTPFGTRFFQFSRGILVSVTS